ncbi:MAG: hypothetical protein ACLPWF_23675 [Bryobacteraceae bacterium]
MHLWVAVRLVAGVAFTANTNLLLWDLFWRGTPDHEGLMSPHPESVAAR